MYSFHNFNSLQALDVPRGGRQSNTQADQWFGNSTNAEKLKLISQ